MSAEYEPDVDAWAKEDCECGHRRYSHNRGVGQCKRCMCSSFTEEEEPAEPQDYR